MFVVALCVLPTDNLTKSIGWFLHAVMFVLHESKIPLQRRKACACYEIFYWQFSTRINKYWIYRIMILLVVTPCNLVGRVQYFHHILVWKGTAVAQWLRCCATNQKIACSIPDGVIGIFHWHNPPDRTMTLRSTQLLTEMSTRRIS